LYSQDNCGCRGHFTLAAIQLLLCPADAEQLVAQTIIVQDVVACLAAHAHAAPLSGHLADATYPDALPGEPATALHELLARVAFCAPRHAPSGCMYPLTTPSDSEARASDVCFALVAALRARGAACLALALRAATAKERGAEVSEPGGAGAADGTASVLSLAVSMLQHVQRVPVAACRGVPAGAVQRVQSFVVHVAGAHGDAPGDARDVLSWQSAAVSFCSSAAGSQDYVAVTSWLDAMLDADTHAAVHAWNRSALLHAAHASMVLAQRREGRGGEAGCQGAACGTFELLNSGIMAQAERLAQTEAGNAAAGQTSAGPCSTQAAGTNSSLAECTASARDLSSLLALTVPALGPQELQSKTSEAVDVARDHALMVTSLLCSVLKAAATCAPAAATSDSTAYGKGTQQAGAAMFSLLESCPAPETAFALVDAFTGGNLDASTGASAHFPAHACALLASVTARHHADPSADTGCANLLVSIDVTARALDTACVDPFAGQVASAEPRTALGGDRAVSVHSGLARLLVHQLTLLHSGVAEGRCDAGAADNATQSVADLVMPPKVCLHICCHFQGLPACLERCSSSQSAASAAEYCHKCHHTRDMFVCL
jgi:hypothetical protein